MQSTTIAVTLDPATAAKLAAEADKAGETLADYASKKLGANLDALNAQVTGEEPAKGKGKKG